MPRLAGMKLDEIKAGLQSLKGRGAWLEIAKRTGIHYDTVARIARGAIGNPTTQTVEAIAEALVWLQAEKAAEPLKEASNG